MHEGHGPYLLLVHGFLSSPSQWLLNLPSLGKFCRPVSVTLHGHNDAPSPSHAKSYHPSEYVVAFEGLRTQLGISRWFVCGYSLGAAPNIRYALEFNGACIGHIFTNSSSAFASVETTSRWRNSSETATSTVRQLRIQALDRIPIHPRHAKRLPANVKAALLADASKHNPDGIAMTMRWTTPYASVREIVNQNAIPALLICGRFEKRFRVHR